MLASDWRATRRKIVDQVMFGVVVLCAGIGVAVLAVILVDVLMKGAPALNLAFFTERPLPLGEVGGGVAPAIIGTLLMLAVAALIGVPIGVGTAIYLAEYGRGRFAAAVASRSTCWPGMPSIVVGVFVWALLVRNVVRRSSPASPAAIALAIIMVPIVTRTVEEMLRLVPDTLREASLGAGRPARRRRSCSWCCRRRKAGIVTGVDAVAGPRRRRDGAAAADRAGQPVLQLRPAASRWRRCRSRSTTTPSSPYADWHTKAWGSALVLIIVIGMLSLLTRWRRAADVGSDRRAPRRGHGRLGADGRD